MAWLRDMLGGLYRPRPKAPPLEAPAEALYANYKARTRDVFALDAEACAPILECSPEVRAAIAVTALVEAEKHRSLTQLYMRLMRARLPLTPAQLKTMVRAQGRQPYAAAGSLLGALERVQTIDAELQTELRHLQKVYRRVGNGKATQRLTRLLEGEVESPQLAGTLIAPAINAASALAPLVAHCRGGVNKARPGPRWRQKTTNLVAQVGAEAFRAHLTGWLADTPLELDRKAWRLTLSGAELDALRGLVWAAGETPGTALMLGTFAARCFRKIPDFGAASVKLGNACVYALGVLPEGEGVAHLTGLSNSVRYAQARRVIEVALESAAEAAGLSRADLEEVAVPDFGLPRSVAVGEHQAQLLIEGKALLRWVAPNGQLRKGVPKAVKEGHPEQLKALKAEHKALTAVLEAQPARLEQLWLQDRRLPFAELRERYLAHPVVGTVASRLLWLAGEEAFMWIEGEAQGLGGALTLGPESECRLWHPLDESDPEVVLVWRDRLESMGCTQPFPQLHRPRYLADGQARFAGHILRQMPFHARCQKQGWRYTVQGHWDSANTPQKTLDAWGLMAELDVDPIEHRDDSHTFAYVVTGALRFRELGAELIHGEVPVAEVPPLVFSEVAYEVDRMISRCTVANDPAFDRSRVRRQYTDYFEAATWGPLTASGQARREALARLLPELRVALTLEGDFLRAGQHEIHLGTTQARLIGTQEVLNVPIGRAQTNAVAKLFLPFEGDALLATILAKAFALAS